MLLLAAKVVPVWGIAALWGAICAAAVFTPMLFSTGEKQLLAASLRRIGRLARGAFGRC